MDVCTLVMTTGTLLACIGPQVCEPASFDKTKMLCHEGWVADCNTYYNSYSCVRKDGSVYEITVPEGKAR